MNSFKIADFRIFSKDNLLFRNAFNAIEVRFLFLRFKCVSDS
jgi:hypothetical protein